MNQRELIWVGFPYSDFSERKIRPALVVSNDNYNAKSEDIVVCAITSNKKAAQYSVALNQKSMETGTLPLPSRVKADKIMQISKRLALKSFARLDAKKFAEVADEIQKLIK
ncbi:MAG: type II toxin-antitoxin system PemK/MazF family toxin [archaeon]|nr:type II toxin-antitoxin system PemK/MazF family toxin [archaeon]